MTRAWYEHGSDEPIPSIRGLQSGFVIIVDTNNKATNFISFEEDCFKNSSNELDSSNLSWTDDWEKFTTVQKLEKVNQEIIKAMNRAKAAHIKNGQGQQQVWIVNKAKDKVKTQMQVWSFISILEAKTESGPWKAI